MMNGKIFERCLVWVICKKAQEMTPPINDTELSARAIMGVDNPVNAWRSIRNGQKGKFRSLSVEEAHNMAKALGTSIDKLCWDTFNELRHGWSLEQDVSKTKPNSGRPKKMPEKNQRTKEIPAPTKGPAQPSANGTNN